MALSIKNDEADRLAREVTEETGETLTEAVMISLQERLERLRRAKARTIGERLRRLREEVAAMPVVDSRSADEIIGYDENGLPA